VLQAFGLSSQQSITGQHQQQQLVAWALGLAWPCSLPAWLRLRRVCLAARAGIDGRFWGLPRQKVSGIWPSQITRAGGTVLLKIRSNHHRRQSVKARALFSSQKILQNFSDSPSHRIFGHMHETLNIDKK
jgi:hypothetical protein